MKKAAIILALVAVIVTAILLRPRPGTASREPAPVTTAEPPASPNNRTRPERESDPARGENPPGDPSSPSSARKPADALADAVSRLKDPELGIALAEILGRWSASDPLAALAWVQASGRDDADDLRTHVIFSWSTRTPEAAATWLEENPGMQKPANLLALLGPWMDQSAEAAVAWSTTKLETVQREGILADLLTSCGSEANALALLGEVDPVVADHALQAAVTSLADEEPDLAEKLSALITGPVDAPEEKPELESTSPPLSTPSDR